MVANKQILGSGSISGPGNIMGSVINNGPTYAHSYTVSIGENSSIQIQGSIGNNWATITFLDTPAEMSSIYVDDYLPTLITVSGVIGANAALNGTTFTVNSTDPYSPPYPVNLYIDATSTFVNAWLTLGLPDYDPSSPFDSTPGITFNWD